MAFDLLFHTEPLVPKDDLKNHDSMIPAHVGTLLRRLLKRYFNTIGQTLFTTLVLWVLTYILLSLYVRNFHLQNLPGPRMAAYTRFWLSKSYAQGCLFRVLHETSIVHGPLARVGPNRLLVSDAKETIRILSPRSRYERGPWYDAFMIDPDRPTIVSQRQRPVHLHMRYQMAAGVRESSVAFHRVVSLTLTV